MPDPIKRQSTVPTSSSLVSLDSSGHGLQAGDLHKPSRPSLKKISKSIGHFIKSAMSGTLKVPTRHANRALSTEKVAEMHAEIDDFKPVPLSEGWDVMQMQAGKDAPVVTCYKPPAGFNTDSLKKRGMEPLFKTGYWHVPLPKS
ncbi:MAG: hypothetical protein EOO24_02305 [Comamonadaceae bacterium]|nr:MAG: hypothetical protein EOO24_02305 [Comamonadaceae bacterium]